MPEVSASSMIERSAEMGGPGQGVGRVGGGRAGNEHLGCGALIKRTTRTSTGPHVVFVNA